MMQFETLDYTEGAGVARVVLNRPEALNAFNEKMMRELNECWLALRSNDDVQVVVLTGAGDRAFCTGIDRMEFVAGDLVGDEMVGTKGATLMHFDDPSQFISPKTGCDLWKPIVAAVNGMACGGAFYLLGEVDLIIAADTATFFDPHTTYGMAAVFESMMMLQRMPLGETLRMALMGAFERISAARALQIGLASEVVAAADLMARATEIAEIIASQPALALQATVRAIWAAQDLGYRQALDMGKILIQLGTDDENLRKGQERFTSERVKWGLR